MYNKPNRCMIWSQESYGGTNSFGPALCNTCNSTSTESPPRESMIKVKEEEESTSEAKVEASAHHIEKSSSEDKLSKEVADMLLQTLRNKCKSYQNKLEEKRKNEHRLRMKLFRSKKQLNKLKLQTKTCEITSIDSGDQMPVEHAVTQSQTNSF